MINLFVLIEENVEIDIPGPLVDQLAATQGPFDVLKFIEESQGLEICFHLKSRAQSRCFVSVFYFQCKTHLADSIEESILL